MPAVVAKAALLILRSERGRRAVGWVIAAALSPVLLLVAVICALASGAAASNASAVDLCFHGGAIPSDVSPEYRERILGMRESFAALDARAAELAASGAEIDANAVKAAFFVLYFSAKNAEDGVDIAAFADCFADADLDAALADAEAAFGITVAASGRANIAEVYARVTMGGGDSYSGGYERGGGSKDTELDVSGFVNPAVKNNLDLAAFAERAWESGWGYVWGTFGGTLTESALQSKLSQYPAEVGKYEEFIRDNWLNGRTADCVGLIKAYGWLDAGTRTIRYNPAAFPDGGANSMYSGASVKGAIATMPDVPGLAVWHKGHIGVYIGNGEVVEAMGTKYGVVRTKLSGRSWTHWLEVPNITYYYNLEDIPR
jgi:hypothetical protein